MDKNENLNLTKILKDAPEGMKLWSPLYGDCAFINVDLTDVIYPIKCQITTKDRRTTYVGFTKDGRLDIQYENGGCVLFPSEENMDWSTFRITKEHKCFEPFHKNMDKTINSNGFDYVDLGLPSGTLWATCNVGADKPSDFGLYFQWGDTQGYTAAQVGIGEGQKQFASDESDYKWGVYPNYTKYTNKGEALDIEDDAAHVNMGGEWHMPTPTQIQELLNTAYTTNEWTTQDGINGRLFTSKSDPSKSIFFPAAGGALDGSVQDSGDFGYVWSSLLHTGYANNGQYLIFYSFNAGLYSHNRCGGLSVRGVIDRTVTDNKNGDKKLDLVEILKDIPKGTKLWSPVCGECFFKAIREKSSAPIVCRTMSINGDYHTICFTKEGKRSIGYANAECVLFPAKNNLNWSTLRPSKSHKEFKNFQKVLVKDWCDKKWVAGFYSHYDDSQDKHCLVGFAMVDDENIIPYEGNEDKIGKTIE